MAPLRGAVLLSAYFLAASAGVGAGGAVNALINTVTQYYPSYNESEDSAWTANMTALPYSWHDYYVDVDVNHTHNNLLIEVEDLNPDVEGYKNDALSLHLFGSSINVNRMALQIATTAVDLIYSITIDSHHLYAQKYYFSVKGGPVAATYKMRVLVIHSDLVVGHSAHGTVCNDAWMYHSLTMANAHTLGHVMTFLVATSAYSILAQASYHAPPTKLVPPYRKVGATTDILRLCHVLDGEHVYLGIYGIDHCVSYTVSVVQSNETEAECNATQHYAHHTATGNIHGLPALAEGQSQHGKCTPNSYEDFYMHIGHGASANNLVLDVEALTDSLDTGALGLYLFEGSIPADRKTERRSTFSDENVWSVMYNSWDLHEGDFFVSVKCGASPMEFRLLPLFIKAELAHGGHASGVVCPGQIAYHYFDAPHESCKNFSAGVDCVSNFTAGNATSCTSDAFGVARSCTYTAPTTGHHDVEWELELHTGDVSYMTSHENPPLKLRPPYRTVDSKQVAAGHRTETSVCNADRGKTYLALRGQQHCAQYDVYTKFVNHSSTCEELVNECRADCMQQCDELQLEHFIYDQCEAGSWLDYKLQITTPQAKSNMVVTVEAIGTTRTPEALSVHMFKGSIPTNRQTEHRTQYAPDYVWGLGVSANDLKTGVIFYSVKCGPKPVRFRILAQLVKSELDGADLISGSVCPGQWMYHSYQHDGSLSTDVAHHIDFKLKMFTGDVEYLTQHDHPPLKLVPPYGHASSEHQLAHHTEDHVSICNVDHGKHFLALRGGIHCALYEVSVHIYTGACTPQAHTGGMTITNGIMMLEFGHFHLGECSPGEYEDYYFDLVMQPGKTHLDVNVVIEVEDLSESMNPEALALYVYTGSIPPDRETELRRESTVDQTYSVSINANEIHAGRYFVSVRCGDEPARFRILPRTIQSSMSAGDHVVGIVCPGDFILHTFEAAAQGPAQSGNVRIESNTTGHTSTVNIGSASGGHAKYLFGDPGIAHVGHDELEAVPTPPGNGSYTGATFLAYDFSAQNENLVVRMNGHDVTIALQVNIPNLTVAQHVLQANLLAVPGHPELGATVTVTSGVNVTFIGDETLKIQSQVPGSSSTVTIDVAQSGAHAVALFGNGSAVAGHNGFASCSATPATRGNYVGTVFHPHDFSSHHENLIVIVDGAAITVALTTDISSPAALVAVLNSALTGVCGATASVVTNHNLNFSLELHSGDAFYMTRHGDAPLRLAPPYRHADYTIGHAGHHTDVSICNADTGKVYLALYGGDKCAEYDLHLALIDEEKTCTEMRHDVSAGVGHAENVLQPDHITDGRCDAHETKDYAMVVASANVDSNLVVIAQDKSGNINTNALSLALYEDHIPDDRKTEVKQEFSSTQAWSVTVDAHHLHPGKFFISVTCGSDPVAYRLIPRLFQAKLGTY